MLMLKQRMQCQVYLVQHQDKLVVGKILVDLILPTIAQLTIQQNLRHLAQPLSKLRML